jgi:hypothetical protein
LHKTISLGASTSIAASVTKDHMQRLEPMVWTKVLVFLIALSPLALEAADWVPISSDYESSIYYDRDSLKREGDMVEVVLLWDFPDVQLTRRPAKPYLSATRLTRYRCGAGGRANVETTLYRANMASGEITEVYRTPEAEIRFEWVNPEAPGGESMRRVCDE